MVQLLRERGNSTITATTTGEVISGVLASQDYYIPRTNGDTATGNRSLKVNQTVTRNVKCAARTIGIGFIHYLTTLEDESCRIGGLVELDSTNNGVALIPEVLELKGCRRSYRRPLLSNCQRGSPSQPQRRCPGFLRCRF